MKSVSTSHHLMSLFVCLTYVKGECSIRSLLGLEPFGGCSIRPGSPTHPLMTKNNQEIGFSHFISSQRERERQEGNTMCVCKSPAVSSRGEYLSKSSETVCPEKHRQTAFYLPLVSSDPQPSALQQLVTRVPHFENTLDCNVFYRCAYLWQSKEECRYMQIYWISSADLHRSHGHYCTFL